MGQNLCRQAVITIVTDENVDPDVAEGCRRRAPAMKIVALRDWQGGGFLQADDFSLLLELRQRNCVLATHDRTTIPALLRQFHETGLDHAGVILFLKSIPQSAIGLQIRALIQLWQAHGREDWTNQVIYLAGA